MQQRTEATEFLVAFNAAPKTQKQDALKTYLAETEAFIEALKAQVMLSSIRQPDPAQAKRVLEIEEKKKNLIAERKTLLGVIGSSESDAAASEAALAQVNVIAAELKKLQTELTDVLDHLDARSSRLATEREDLRS